MPVIRNRVSCIKQKRSDLDKIARRSLGRPFKSWRALNKENLCFALNDHFKEGAQMAEQALKSARQSRVSPPTAKEKLNANVGAKLKPNVSNALSVRFTKTVYPLKNPKVGKIIGEGEQGVVNILESGTSEIVRKVARIDKDDMKLIGKKIAPNSTSYPAHKLLQHSSLLVTEAAAETIGVLLTDQLVRQNICPHFPLLYNVSIVESDSVTDMELIPGGVELTKWAKQRHSEQEWYSTLFQIVAATHALYVQFGIVHDDLHTHNVMMYDLGKSWQKNSYFHYIINGFDYYVPVKGQMVCIIDFGRIWLPGVVEIKWHLKKNRPKKRHAGTFDACWLLGDLAKVAPAAVRKNLLHMLSNIAHDVETYTDIFEVFFSKSVHGDACGKQWPACYDVKPTGRNHIITFNTDARVNLSPLPASVKALLKN